MNLNTSNGLFLLVSFVLTQNHWAIVDAHDLAVLAGMSLRVPSPIRGVLEACVLCCFSQWWKTRADALGVVWQALNNDEQLWLLSIVYDFE